MFRSEYWYRFPWLVMLPALGLVALGIAGIYSATAGGEETPFWETPAFKQLLWTAAGLAVFLLALVPSYVRLARASYFFYGLSLALLVLLAAMRALRAQIPGILYPINNAYSWLRVPGTGISGVEPRTPEMGCGENHSCLAQATGAVHSAGLFIFVQYIKHFAALHALIVANRHLSFSPGVLSLIPPPSPD